MMEDRLSIYLQSFINLGSLRLDILHADTIHGAHFLVYFWVRVCQLDKLKLKAIVGPTTGPTTNKGIE